MTYINKVLITGTLASITLLNACRSDKTDVGTPINPNEAELITTLEIQLIDSLNTADTLKFLFNDPDGEGGRAPIAFDTLKLKKDHTYFCNLKLEDRSKNPVVNVSEELEEEAVDHEFFFSSKSNTFQFKYLDKDSNGLPLGLKTKWRTSSVATDQINVILKHQPGIKKGSILDGDTDLDLSFNLLSL